ncbi:carboxy-terminal domain RNA polymerase II polypeptide A small phosphatase [Andreprevotia lacus DSM 23236]|uniref:Carboxy-terminal domain RNA polymerase II polypeptide A small phosphatase n=1 Tax=Andreprevotia lacus DSM 23236 TaxID=1121001 RepID=A0A1W1XFH8_9NEIS|nr:HAD family hydrolase [Andreprevotia lacus]SMC22785.1 carboxy-terminal domain RNA polymerase II polypeptide A small phosphatase [Andreprevotia lacus DSM 23236]
METAPQQQLLILDLDETLIHASHAALDRPCDFRVASYHVYRRPGVADFLAFCQRHFTVAIWTSSTAPYAAEVVTALFPVPDQLLFVYARNRCVRAYDPEFREDYFIKDLRKVRKFGFPLERILVIDDTPQKLCRHYGNLIRIPEWTGDEADRELLHMMDYLLTLKDVTNVRKVEKRRWRSLRETPSQFTASFAKSCGNHLLEHR